MREETSFWLAFKMILTLSSKTNTDFHGEAPIRNQYNIHINLTNVASVFLHHQANDLFSVKFKGLGVPRPLKAGYLQFSLRTESWKYFPSIKNLSKSLSNEPSTKSRVLLSSALGISTKRFSL